MLKLDILVGHLTDEYRINVPGIYDIDAKFNGIKVENTDYNRRAVYSIDKGQLLDKGCFIDRFGRTLKVDSLSTGCKTAILVGAFPTQLVSAIECGENALFQIIKNCKDGHILMYEPTIGIMKDTVNDTPIDVQLGKYRFTSLDRLNHYFTDEIFLPPEEIDMGMKGIEYARV